MYHFDLTLTTYMYEALSGKGTDLRHATETNVGHILAHQLHMDILRAHLRLSVQDLMDPVKQKRHSRVLLL
jgi:hypothetical protein